MFVRTIVSTVVMLAGTLVLGDDTFYVFAPDQKNQQLLSIEVRSVDDGVSVRQGEPLRLPFGPTGITAHHENTRLIVSSASQADPDGTPVASVEILEAGKLRIIETSSPTGARAPR